MPILGQYYYRYHNTVQYQYLAIPILPTRLFVNATIPVNTNTVDINTKQFLRYQYSRVLVLVHVYIQSVSVERWGRDHKKKLSGTTSIFHGQRHWIIYQLRAHVETNILTSFSWNFSWVSDDKTYQQSNSFMVVNSIIDSDRIDSVLEGTGKKNQFEK